MNVRIEAASGENQSFASNDFSSGADDRCRRPAECRDFLPCRWRDVSVLDADIRLHDAPIIDDQRIGDHGVDRALLA